MIVVLRIISMAQMLQIHYHTLFAPPCTTESNCAYTLVKDAQDGLFSISIQNDPSCRNNINTTSPSMCPRVIRIFIQGKEYTLAVNTAGLPEFRSPKKVLPIPSQLAHARVEATSGGRFIVVSLDAVGLSIKWDGAKMVQVEASEALWNRTAGLCGNMNGEREDDVTGGVMHPGTGWRIENIGGMPSVLVPGFLRGDCSCRICNLGLFATSYIKLKEIRYVTTDHSRTEFKLVFLSF